MEKHTRPALFPIVLANKMLEVEFDAPQGVQLVPDEFPVDFACQVVREDLVDISYDGRPAAVNGVAAETALEELQEVVAREQFTIDIDLHLGDGSAVVYSCDCTEEYVRINR